MKQSLFEQQFRHDWQLFEQQLTALEALAPGARRHLDLATFPGRYRQLCHHQALARERGYSLSLIEHLDALVLRGYRQLYRPALPIARPLREFLLAGFPRAVRAQWRWQLASLIVFAGASLLLWWLVREQQEMVYSLLDVNSVENMESMYQPQAEHRHNRDSEDDITMFGFYIYNNIGIAFRTFAGGLLFGIGSLVVMLFNGSYFGAVAAHLTNVGYQEPFFTFVIAHAAPELTAIVMAGGAGLKLGWSLLAPGPLRRIDALRQAAQAAMTIMYGVFLLLLLAAFIEAFWSPRLFAPAIKYAVGTSLWLLLLAWLALAGRRR